jgi:hypothetical protein
MADIDNSIETADVQDTAVETTDMESTAPETGAEDTGAQVDGQTDMAADDTTPKQSRASERIQRLIEERNEWKAKYDEAAQRQAQPAQETQPDKTPNEHPALKGKWVQDGQVLDTDTGDWKPVQQVIREYETEDKVTRLERMILEDREARKQVEQQAREQAALSQLGDAVLGRISEVREASLGDLPGGKEAAQAFDNLIGKAIRDDIYDAYQTGKFTPELADSLIKQAVSEVRKLTGAVGVKQYVDNQEYANTHKAKPGGATGTKPAKAWHQMTSKEQDAAIAAAYQKTVNRNR